MSDPAMTRRRTAALMAFAAITLAIAATLHLTHFGGDGKPPFAPDRAGIAEAVIAGALIGGTLAVLRGARRLALATVVFAIAGFCIGLSITLRGGTTADVAYHAAMLPILLITLAQFAGIGRLGKS